MSDLTKFRDHCAKMAAEVHRPECQSLAEPKWIPWDEGDEVPNGARIWRDMGLVQVLPMPCDGCVTDADRALFTQMAGEVDDYLAPQVDLFGELTTEPPQTESEAVTVAGGLSEGTTA